MSGICGECVGGNSCKSIEGCVVDRPTINHCPNANILKQKKLKKNKNWKILKKNTKSKRGEKKNSK